MVNGNMTCLNFGLGGGGGIGCSSEWFEARKDDVNEEASRLAPGKGRQEERQDDFYLRSFLRSSLFSISSRSC